MMFFTPPSGTSGPIVAPLSGTFTVFRSQDVPPNTLFGLTITHIDLSTGSQVGINDGSPKPYGCGGEISLGCISATTLDFPPFAFMFALVSINAQDFGLVGSGDFDTATDPPTFRNLELCGGVLDHYCDAAAIRSGAPGYIVTISAVPEAAPEQRR